MKILSYLDLKSLFRMGQVSRLFYEISTHPLLYVELSLKPYWQVANSELLCTLARRATMLKKLDLSWCGGFGEVSPTEFKKSVDKLIGWSLFKPSLLISFDRFLTQRGDNLSHLRLNSCKFLNASCIETIGIVCDNLTGNLNCFTHQNIDLYCYFYIWFRVESAELRYRSATVKLFLFGQSKESGATWSLSNCLWVGIAVEYARG